MSVVVEVGEGMEGATGSLALHLWGILCTHEGRYYAAEEAFLRAVEAKPEMVGTCVELGLVYACRGEYPKMVEALGRAVDVGTGGVRAYLGERPLGDVTANAAAGTEGDGEGVASLAMAIAYLAEGRDAEATVILQQSLDNKPGSPPLLVALLALTYLLQGHDVEADGAGIRRVTVAVEGVRW